MIMKNKHQLKIMQLKQTQHAYISCKLSHWRWNSCTPPTKWPHEWPTHVGGTGCVSYTFIHLCAFVGSDISNFPVHGFRSFKIYLCSTSNDYICLQHLPEDGHMSGLNV